MAPLRYFSLCFLISTTELTEENSMDGHIRMNGISFENGGVLLYTVRGISTIFIFIIYYYYFECSVIYIL